MLPLSLAEGSSCHSASDFPCLGCAWEAAFGLEKMKITAFCPILKRRKRPKGNCVQNWIPFLHHYHHQQKALKDLSPPKKHISCSYLHWKTFSYYYVHIPELSLLVLLSVFPPLALGFGKWIVPFLPLCGLFRSRAGGKSHFGLPKTKSCSSLSVCPYFWISEPKLKQSSNAFWS